MAFLLLLHEKLRLRRTKNKLTLRQTQAGHRKDRISKRIERVQKMYNSRMSQIDSMVKRGTSMFRYGIMNQLGIGTQGLNPMMTGMMGGMSMFGQQAYGALAAQFGSDVVQAMLSGALVKDKDGNYNINGKGVNIDDAKYTELNQKVMEVKMQEGQRQYMAQAMQTYYENAVSVWEEAAKAQLEAEQDAVLAPLQEQETDWELEEETVATQLESVKARLEAIESALGEEIKDSAPKFGLG